MATANFGRTGVLGGETFGNSVQVEIEAEAVQTRDSEVSAGKVGVLSTRTDADTGVATLSGGHGVSSSDRVDVYWTGGSRRGMAATVSSNDVTIDGGSGDDLPAQSTEVVVMVCTEEAHVVTGNDVKALALYTPARGTFVFAESDDSEVFAVTLDAGGVFHWWEGSGLTNPLAGGAVTKVFLTHADSESAQTMKIGILHN